MTQSKRQTSKRITAADLDINVGNHREQHAFYWLMCVILFSKPIQQEIAGQAFTVLRDHKYDSPQALKKAGWQAIVDALNEANYVRYDESTATRLLQASEYLLEHCDGKIKNFIASNESADELKVAIQKFNGIGETGADIFLREIAPVYYK